MPTINLGKRKNPDKTVYTKYRQGFYQSKVWKGLRAAKVCENPVCEKCEREGRTTQTQEVHHKKPWETGLTEDQRWYLFTLWENLESLCTPCHHEEEMRLKSEPEN